MTYLYELAFNGAPRLLFWSDGTYFAQNDTTSFIDTRKKTGSGF